MCMVWVFEKLVTTTGVSLWSGVPDSPPSLKWDVPWSQQARFYNDDLIYRYGRQPIHEPRWVTQTYKRPWSMQR